VAVALELRGSFHDELHAIVREGLARLRTALAEVARSLPRHVERELEGFLGCGDPENGFAWLWCAGCDAHRLVPFSCKGRGFCPSCGGRRMAERAAWWVDRVIPHVATRQWVLTVPWKRRWLLARNPALARGVHAVAMRRIERWYADQAGRLDAKGGSISIQQRFGSALNLNLHYHCILLDGVYTRGAGGRLSFRRVTPHTVDVERLVVEIAEACEAWLAGQGYGPEEEGAAGEEDAQAVLQQASLLGQAALGERAGKRARRVQVRGGREFELPPRCAAYEGYNLHAGVGLAAGEREALERLCRYLLRPPLARDRVLRQEDGTVEVGLKRVWSDGTRAILFTPLEFVERLAAIVPPPRVNQVVYRGVLSANAAWRREVIPRPKPEAPDAAAARAAKKLRKSPPIRIVDEKPGWAELLARVFGKDGFACAHCGGTMVLRCLVLAPPATTRILRSLAKGTAPP
jgi:hypothetical protein